MLHTLRCIGAVTLERLADVSGLSETDVQTELIDLAVDGLVVRDAGAFGGWRITDAGRAADASRIGSELDASGERTAVQDAFDTFMVLNPKLLEICTAWQTREIGSATEVNDHSDPAYDAKVLDQLGDLHRRAEAICDDLTEALDRFARYRVRLSDALVRANAGETSYVADDMASYHNVWFQLHEDLLITLGIPRRT